jgi:glycosyltransferase involved in cell wall biosynthesis
VLTVGIQRRTYPEERNVLAFNQDRVAFEIVASDPARMSPQDRADAAASRMFDTYAYWPDPATQVDCYHLFNALPLTEVPFVATFETALPRWYGAGTAAWERGYAILEQPYCRRLYAMSGNCIGIMRDTLQRRSAAQAERIMAKVELLYPPQAPHPAIDLAKFDRLAPLRIAFIGADFQRKGGCELVAAASTLLAEGADLHVTLVTDLVPRPEPAIWSATAVARAAHARALIERHGAHFTLHGRLANTQVMDILARSHIAALPSYHDTFGFAVLEAQAAMTPVITTDQRAFPELNDEGVGWILKLPLDTLGRMTCSEADFGALSAALQDSLTATLRRILAGGADPIRARAHAALARIRAVHDPLLARDRLLEQYRRAARRMPRGVPAAAMTEAARPAMPGAQEPAVSQTPGRGVSGTTEASAPPRSDPPHPGAPAAPAGQVRLQRLSSLGEADARRLIVPAQEAAWFRPGEDRLFEFRDAHLFSSGVFSAGGVAIEELALACQPNWRGLGIPDYAAADILASDTAAGTLLLRDSQPSHMVDAPLFWNASAWAFPNFGHFIHDLLSQLFYLDQARALYGEPLRIFLPNIAGTAFRYRMQTFLFEELIGPCSDLLVPARGASLRVARLLAAHPTFYLRGGGGALVSAGAIRYLNRRLRERFAGLVDPNSPRRIYITRDDGVAARTLENEAAVRARLVAHGFRPVAVSGLSPPQTVALFSGAEMIAGAHGAGLMNLVFADPRRARVIELQLHPSNWNSIRTFAGALGMDFAPIPARMGEVAGSCGIVDEAALEAVLAG